MIHLDDHILNRLSILASKGSMIQRHAAVIIKGNVIIGEGYNYMVDFMCHQYSIHSEVAAILSLKKCHRAKKYLEDAIMIVVRVTGNKYYRNYRKTHEFKLSAPCDKCKTAIEKAGIRTVYYSS